MVFVRDRAGLSLLKVEGRVPGPLGVGFVGDQHIEKCHDPITVYWFTVPSKRWTPSDRIARKRDTACTRWVLRGPRGHPRACRRVSDARSTAAIVTSAIPIT
jgi:hypothetical protein